jgi:hypothetical protein
LTKFQIKALDWRDLQLWGIGACVLFAVAAGLVILLAPKLLWKFSVKCNKSKELKTLKPSETCQDAIEIRFFADRERPGEYSVQVERDLPAELGKGFVESNTITVSVIT